MTRSHRQAPGSPSRPVVAAPFPEAATTGWSPAPVTRPETAEATA